VARIAGLAWRPLSSVDQILPERPELERRGVFQVLACGLASTQPIKRVQPTGQADSVGNVGARQTADLGELKDWVEGLRTAAHNARQAGNITLAKALDITRFEVYDSYLDEEHTNDRAKRLMIKN
jgi:hypothetical protein